MTEETPQRRSVRKRVGTLLDVDQTVAHVDATSRNLAGLLVEFETTLGNFTQALDRFSVALDRFSDAAEKIDGVAANLDSVIEGLAPVLGGIGVVTSPVGLARRGVRRVTRRDDDPASTETGEDDA